MPGGAPRPVWAVLSGFWGGFVSVVAGVGRFGRPVPRGTGSGHGGRRAPGLSVTLGAVVAHPALDRAEVPLAEPPHPEGTATGPAWDNLSHIVTPCNASPGKGVVEDVVAAGGVSPVWASLSWALLPPATMEGVEGVGYDVCGARAGVSAGVGGAAAAPSGGVAHGQAFERGVEDLPITARFLPTQRATVINPGLRGSPLPLGEGCGTTVPWGTGKGCRCRGRTTAGCTSEQ